MAFQRAAGYNNLPNGNFSPVIYSKKAQLAFRKASVASDIAVKDYFGEISELGDTVRIIKEPSITVVEYARGAQITPQDLDDEDFSLVIDKSHAFAFRMDDIEQAHAHVDFMAMAADRAGYELADQFDMETLGYFAGYKQSSVGSVADTVNDQVSGTKAIDSAGSDELLSSMKLNKGSFGNITTSGAGDHSIPVAPRLPGMTALPTAYVSPVMLFNRMATLLDRQNVPKENRWLVIDPVIKEILMDEDSRIHNADFGPSGSLRSGDAPVIISGFKIYVSNNLPQVGNGPSTTGTANQNTDYGVIIAGHTGSVAAAEQLNKVENLRDPNSFGDVVRGLHLYGRKILRPEGIVTAKYNAA